MDIKNYELTNPQKSIWYTEQFYKGTSVNNICGTIYINEVVNFELLKKAMFQFLKDNDAFRLKLSYDEKGNVKQYVSEFKRLNIDIVDLNSKDEISKLEQEMVNIPFDIINSNLFTFKMYRLPNGFGGLVLVAHHLVCDAFTTGIVANKLTSIYSALLNGEKYEGNKTSYIDYLNSENEYLKSDKFIKDKEYWNTVFETIPEIGTIPSVLQEGKDSCAAKRKSFIISKTKLKHINKFCSDNKMSAFNFFMAIYAIYIGRVSNLDDFVLGTPILNRSNFAEKNTPGMFISTVPLRFNIDGKLSFIDFGRKIASDSFSMLRHQKYPYQNLLDDIRKINPNQPNLYDIMLSYQVTKADRNSSNIDYNVNWTFNNNVADSMQIHLFDINDDGILNICYDYRTNKYSEKDIKNIHDRILFIIDQILENNQVKLKDLEIVTPKEREIILKDFNNTHLKYDKTKTVVDYFEEQVKKTPDNIALVCNNKSMSYKELNEKANKLAYYLKKSGVKQNAVIGIMVHRSPEMIIGLLAILKVGACYLPLDPEYPKERISYILEDSSCKTILVQKETNNLINNNYMKVNISLDADIYLSNYKKNIDVKISPNDLIYMIYTSGSTGNPKGVMLTHKNINNFIIAEKKHIDFSENKVMLSVTTICFDIFALEIWCSLTSGMKVVLANETEQLSPKLLKDLCINNNVNMMQTTPSRYSILTSDITDSIFWNSFTDILVGGEPFPKDLLTKLQKNTKANIFNMYGPTETTVWSTIKNLTNSSTITIGKPIANTTCYILDKNKKLLPIDVPGELYIGGDGVSSGYWNKKDLTNEKFIKSPFIKSQTIYNTNDLAYYTKSGEIVHLGRTDFQVKIRGYRIELEEIENKISNYPNIKSCVVNAVENSTKLCAYYISNKEIDISKLRNYLSNELPNYMIPNYFMKMDSFPYTPNGKINKKAFPNTFSSENKEIYIAPKTDTEIKLVNIWKKLFNLNKISINNNFFDIGGDSLLAIKLSSIISSKFNVDIIVSDIFANPILVDLARLIDTKTVVHYDKIKHCKKKDSYDVSSAQKRIYYASKLDDEDSVLYNMPGVIIFNKTPDIQKLDNCLQTLFERHSSLRTSFEVVDDVLKQKIQNNIDFNLEIETCRKNNIDEIIKSFVKPFDLSQAPLFRVKLVKSTNKSYLLFDMHHIISDGMSLTILTKELSKLYNDETLTENHFDYIDYAEWEKEKLENNYFEESKIYWKNQFNNDIPILNIPSNYTRPIIKSYEGKKIYKTINKNLTEKINKLSEKLDVSNYMILLACYYILLSKYTSQEDIIIGSPVVGRNKSELLNIIGMFVNTLPLRNHIDSSTKFIDFVNNLKKQCIDAIEHSNYPFDELVKDLNIERDVSRNPLFDTLFTYQNEGVPSLHFKDLNSELYIPDTNISKFDLSLEIIPSNDELKLNFEYCIKLFNEETIERLSKHFINIIENIVDNENIIISDINMLSNEERNKILYNFNATDMKYPKDKTIIQLFEEQVLKYPNNIAVEYENEKLTYNELNEKANKLASELSKSNIKNGEAVGVLLPRSIELIISIIAILKNNAIYVPLYSEYPKDRINYMITNSNTKIIITNSTFKSLLNKEANSIVLDDYNKVKPLKSFKHTLNTPNDVVYIIYTSGSTGKPKGVQISNKCLNNFIHSFNKYFKNIDNNDNFLSSTSISFDVSIFELFLPILNGSTLVLYHNELIKDIADYCEYIIKHKITALYIPPNILNEVYSILKNKTNVKINKLLVGVEAIKPETLNKYFLLNPKMCIINGYGPTETTICCSALEYLRNMNNNLDVVSIGHPLYNDKIYILDKNMNVQPIGVPGELYITGDGVGPGYINNKTENSKNFLNNIYDNASSKMYKTGDIGKWNSDGTISLIGRKDNQVKISGHRIELKEIDNIIMNYPNIEKSISIIAELGRKKHIASYFVADNQISIEDLISFLKTKLPSYMIPSSLLQLEQFPLTSNGKIDKTKLPAVKIQSKAKYVAPRNNFEEKIVDIWKNLFLIDTIGIDDNFFDLGGDSLTAIKFQTEAMNIGLDISYADIFSYSTPRELAEKHNSNKKDDIIYNDAIDYDYSRIKDLISENRIENLINMDTSLKKTGNVLLFGSTGFLGSHILNEFLSKTKNTKVYCVIRKKLNVEPEIRLKEILNYYFGNKYDKEFGKRIIVINGDITENNFSLNKNDYNKLSKNIDIVINSAAIVKHYGNLEKFRDINVNGTINVIKFCNIFKKKLYYISTLSVSGNASSPNNNEVQYFKETDLYINQDLSNVYIYSKFEAEKRIFEAIQNGLQACILRVGNITNRYTDSRFQFNVSENAFINRLKSIINLGILQENFLEHSLEFTPVDICASAIVKIIQNNPEYTVFHLFNDNFIKISRLLEILNSLDINIKPVSDDDFSNKIKLALSDKNIKNEISGIITDLNENKLLELINYIIPDSSFSKAYLKNIGFEWPVIDYEYIKNYIDYFKKIKYI